MVDAPDITPAYLWFDTEFTSLDPGEARLLQVALLITDRNLARLTLPEDDINTPVALEAGAPVSPWVAENLVALVARCGADDAPAVSTVDARLADLVDRVVGPVPEEKEKRPVLAGNSVHADLQMARRWLPAFASRLNYRVLDVSALKIVWNDWRPGAPFDKEARGVVAANLPPSVAMPPGAAHDAYYDVHASLAELNYYRGKLFGRS